MKNLIEAAERGEAIPYSDEAAEYALQNGTYAVDPRKVWKHRGEIPRHCFLPGGYSSEPADANTVSRVQKLASVKWINFKAYTSLDYAHFVGWKVGRHRLNADAVRALRKEGLELKGEIDRYLQAKSEGTMDRLLKDLYEDPRLKFRSLFTEHFKILDRIRKRQSFSASADEHGILKSILAASRDQVWF